MASKDSRPGVRVLYIDDNPDYRFLFQEAVKSVDCSLLVFCLDGYEPGLAYLSGAGPFANRELFPPPAFVLLDYDLDGHTGAEILQWMRARPETRDLPVAMFSGVDKPEHVALCYREGANHFLIKPASWLRLVEIVSTLNQCFAQNPPCYYPLLLLQEYRPPPEAAVADCTVSISLPPSP